MLKNYPISYFIVFFQIHLFYFSVKKFSEQIFEWSNGDININNNCNRFTICLAAAATTTTPQMLLAMLVKIAGGGGRRRLPELPQHHLRCVCKK